MRMRAFHRGAFSQEACGARSHHFIMYPRCQCGFPVFISIFYSVPPAHSAPRPLVNSLGLPHNIELHRPIHDCFYLGKVLAFSFIILIYIPFPLLLNEITRCSLQVNTLHLVRDAHMQGNEISRIIFSYDDRGIATRGGDDTLKLWDIRQLKSPVHVAGDLFNRFPM